MLIQSDENVIIYGAQ